MVLFTTENLDNYRNNEGIKRMLNNVVLLNLDEFTKWFEPKIEPRASKRITEKYIPLLSKKNSNTKKDRSASPIIPTYIRRAESIKKAEIGEINEIRFKVFKELANNVCKDIGQEYARQSVANIKKYADFDLLVAVTPDYLDIKQTTKFSKLQQRKLDKVLGILIAEKGECKERRLTYSVNLICVRKIGSYEVKGSILLGCFLYCIKCFDNKMEIMNDTEEETVDQYAVLELAGSYNNIIGFVSYSKLGFKKNITLLNSKCFRDNTNLPMSVDLSFYDSPKHIIDIVTGSRPIPENILEENDNTRFITTAFKGRLPKTDRDKRLQKSFAIRAHAYYQYELDVQFNEADVSKLDNLIKNLDDSFKDYIISTSPELYDKLYPEKTHEIDLNNQTPETEVEKSKSDSHNDSSSKRKTRSIPEKSKLKRLRSNDIDDFNEFVLNSNSSRKTKKERISVNL